MKRNSTVGKGRGYQEAVVGSFAGALMGVLAARLMTVLLVGLWGLAGLGLDISNALLLVVPPLAATAVGAVALHLSGYDRVGSRTLLMLLVSPLASWLLWEVQQQLGTADLWSLRIVPVVLLTLLAPVAHALARTLSSHSGKASSDELVTSQR